MIAQLDRDYCRLKPGKALVRLISYACFEGRPLTTRGRWLNPMVLALLRMLGGLPLGNRRARPIFIVGTGRSGTTILGKILSLHRQVGFLNEPKALWHLVHPEDDLIGSYSHAPARYRLTADDANGKVCKRARNLMAAYAMLTRSQRVLDKYGEMIFRYDYIKTIFPGACFLFLTRNGWDACRSVARWSDNHAHGGKGADWWGHEQRKWHYLINQLLPEHPDLLRSRQQFEAISDQRAMAALEWVLTMREGLRLQRLAAGDLLRVRYEDLLTDPAGQLGRVCDFTDLEEDATMLSYARQTLRPSTNGKPFPLPELLEAPFERALRELGYA